MMACVLKEESFLFFFKYKNDFPFKVKGSENSDLAWKANEKVSFQGYFRLDQVLSHSFCFDLYRSLLSSLSPFDCTIGLPGELLF